MELDGKMQQAVVGWDLSRVVFRDLERDYPVVERGEGIYLYDTKGRKYIDGWRSLLAPFQPPVKWAGGAEPLISSTQT